MLFRRPHLLLLLFLILFFQCRLCTADDWEFVPQKCIDGKRKWLSQLKDGRMDAKNSKALTCYAGVAKPPDREESLFDLLVPVRSFSHFFCLCV